MKLMRNAEVYRSVIAFAVISAISVITVFIIGRRFLLLTLCMCIAFTLAHFITVFLRYRRISRLSADVNRILHGESQISLEEYSEGELAVLQSEIYKMTIRLREQQNILQEDKVFLAGALADISHQIRTPLTSMNLLVTMLSEQEQSPGKRSELIRRMNTLLSRIDRLVTELLKMSRLDAGTVTFKRETIPLYELIAQACMPVRVLTELREQKLEIAADGTFSGDVAWTSEAIGNIVKNCMEHTPDGGKITIHACENPLYTEIIIEDNGRGIANEDLPHIFERFYKGKSSSDENSGFGIGLSLARMIITKQNGTVKAENIKPSGARFTIRFYKGTI